MKVSRFRFPSGRPCPYIEPAAQIQKTGSKISNSWLVKINSHDCGMQHLYQKEENLTTLLPAQVVNLFLAASMKCLFSAILNRGSLLFHYGPTAFPSALSA
jgi:hypothetical protein